MGAVKGFWHSHVGWLFMTKGLVVRTKYGRDMVEDLLLSRIDRCYFLWVALGFAIPFAVGYAFGGFSAGIEAMIWGGFVRIALFQHVTWSVNSICHMFGERGYESRDESRNNWLLALPSLGEAWHNNHHAFPSSAVHGLDRFQLDLSGLTIRLLEKLGIVWDVKLPDVHEPGPPAPPPTPPKRWFKNRPAPTVDGRPGRGRRRHESNARPQPPQGLALDPLSYGRPAATPPASRAATRAPRASSATSAGAVGDRPAARSRGRRRRPPGGLRRSVRRPTSRSPSCSAAGNWAGPAARRR